MYKLITIILLVSNITIAQNADDIIGKYHLPNNLDVEIFKTNNTYSGRIIALNGFENGQTKDINNPNSSEQKKDLIGKVIIKKLSFDKESKQWLLGKMYGPEKGMFFNLKVNSVNKEGIEVVGSKFLFWRTLFWNKI